MNINKLVKLMPFLLIFVGTVLFTMQQNHRSITIQASDKSIDFNRAIADQIPTIKDAMANAGSDNEAIPLQISADDLIVIGAIITMIQRNPAHYMPEGHYVSQRIQPIIIQLLYQKPIDFVARMIRSVEYLDVDYLANGVCRVFFEKVFGEVGEVKPENIFNKWQEYVPEYQFPHALKQRFTYIYYLTLKCLPELSIRDYMAMNPRRIRPINPFLSPFGLELPDAQITSLEGFDLIPGIEQSKKINLKNNKLAYIPEHVFDKLTNVETLNLDSSFLIAPAQDVLASMFNKCIKLKYLYLSSNKLVELPDHMFGGLAQLRSLRLDNNDLTTLPDTIFDGLDKLQDLELRDNKLEMLAPTIFRDLHNLHNLYVSNNPLTNDMTGSQFIEQYQLPATTSIDLYY